MMGRMKRLAFLGFCVAALAGAVDFMGVHTVYILPMRHGMDQYLASHLTSEHVWWVATDPKNVDAILTDHIGDDFQAQLDQLYPPPEPVKKTPPPEKEAKAAETNNPMLPIDTETKLPPVHSTFGSAKGMLFLVDRKSRQVLWSIYAPPKDFAPNDMDKAAADVVARLQKQLTPNPKKK